MGEPKGGGEKEVGFETQGQPTFKTLQFELSSRPLQPTNVLTRSNTHTRRELGRRRTRIRMVVASGGVEGGNWANCFAAQQRGGGGDRLLFAVA